MIASTAHAQLQYVGVLGSPGDGKGQFDFPRDVCVDSSDNIYVADSGNHRIQKFDKEGNFLFAFGYKGDSFLPTSIAVDTSGNIYVAEFRNYRLDKFDSQGNLIREFAFPDGPGDLVLDSGGNIYICDPLHYCVLKLDSEGKKLLRITIPGSLYDPIYGYVGRPNGIAIDTRGTLYVSAPEKAIKLFDGNGKSLGQLGTPYSSGSLAVSRAGDISMVRGPFLVIRINHRGTVLDYVQIVNKYSAGQGINLQGIAVSSTNRVYVADRQSNTIQILGIGPAPVRPAIAGVFPNAIRVGSNDKVITVRGADFTSDSVVQFGSATLGTTYISSTQLTAVLPASLLRGAGEQPVRVFHPGAGVSNWVNLTVAGEQLVLNSITPNEVSIGDWKESLLIAGLNFYPGLLMRLGGEDLPTKYISPTKLQVQVPGKYRQKATVHAVRLQNPAIVPPPAPPSNALELRVVSPTPSVRSVWLDSAIEQQGDIDVTVSGKGFTTLSQVKFGAKAVKITEFWGSDIEELTELRVTIPGSLLTAVGDFNITVVNPVPGGASNAVPFHVNAGPTELEVVSSPAPAVTRSGKNLIVKVAVKNTGIYTARSVAIQGLLNSASSTAVSPEVFTLESGATKVVTLAFPDVAPRGTTPTVNLNFTSTNAGNGSLTATTAPIP